MAWWGVVQMISKNNNNNKGSNAAMNASKKKAKSKNLKRLEREVDQLSLIELAKTKNSSRKSRNNRNRMRDMNSNYNGGKIDRFPRGNKQGMGFGNKQSVIIEETEYIGEITSNSTSFSLLNTYPINPGQASTFPWLSTIAKNYEKYEFLALQWIYKPEVSQYATNGQTGKILMSVDYDASDAPPQNKQQMEDVVPHSDAMPYQQLKLNCKPKEMHKNSDAKFIRPGNLPANSDIKTYDAGNLFVGISAIATNTGTLGELHVKYIVKFSIPILESQGTQINNSLAEFTDTTPQSLVNNVQAVDLLPNLVGTNGINVVNTSGVMTVPAGNYLVIWTSSFNNSGNNTTVAQSVLQLNGVQVGFGEQQVTAGTANLQTSGTYFWRSDGTSSTGLTLKQTASFASGTQTVTGTMVINSI